MGLGGAVRPIMKRASLAEMIVPYGDVAPDHGFKHVMDVGEYGFGNFANSLELGCDCLGEIRYLDAHYALPDGDTLSKRNVICIHEEDAGILWKHWDHFSGACEVRRSRRLVVSSIHTVGNYEYGIFWYLYLDGSIQLEMKLTGILNTSAVAEGAESVRPPDRRQLAAPHHQHLFCMRLDLDVDGTDNTVVQIDSEALPLGPGNPFQSAFVARETPLRRESEAAVDANTATARYWEIRSASKRNALGEPTGYRLKLGHGTTRMLAPAGTPVAERGAFAQHNLWVTAYHPDERKAAGDYPNQHAGGDGLPGSSRRTASSRAATWWCGRRSGRPTSRARGLARDARGIRRDAAAAVRVLRPEPGDRPAAGERPSLLTGRSVCAPAAGAPVRT